MRYVIIGLLCLLTLQGCSGSTHGNSGSSAGTTNGSIAYGRIGGGGGSGR